MKRREFLRKAGAIGLGLAGGGYAIANLVRSKTPSLDIADYSTLDPRDAGNFTQPIVTGKSGSLLKPISASSVTDISVEQAKYPLGGQQDIPMLLYQVRQNGQNYLNPVLRARSGENLSLQLHNRINQETIIHWHGMHVDEKNDGHPSDVIGRGESYQYDYEIRNRGSAYWYHPHPHGMTGPQVNYGLAGYLLVEDENDDRLRQQLDLEYGETELPLVIQDRRLSENGEILYNLNPMEAFLGYMGDTIFTNYTPNGVLDVDPRIYRFRILNGSNSRMYRLSLTDGSQTIPLVVIGGDGGMLEQPLPANEIFLSAGERLDILVDFSGYREGDSLFLNSLEFDPMIQPMGGRMGRGMGGMQGRGMMGGQGRRGMMGGMMSGGNLNSGTGFHVMKFHLKNSVSYDREIPEQLSTLEPVNTTGTKIRSFELTHGMMEWYINGHQFRMEQVEETVDRDTNEIWEIRNSQGSQPHPMHIHGFHFRVLERLNSPSQVRRLAIDSSGKQVNDLGVKDTVLVWPGETVRTLVDFSHNFSGEQIYLFHCHMLEHSDQGMMINYKVV